MGGSWCGFGVCPTGYKMQKIGYSVGAFSKKCLKKAENWTVFEKIGSFGAFFKKTLTPSGRYENQFLASKKRLVTSHK
jgi:hypothetical protein